LFDRQSYFSVSRKKCTETVPREKARYSMNISSSALLAGASMIVTAASGT
jgi:hypothetical protein